MLLVGERAGGGWRIRVQAVVRVVKLTFTVDRNLLSVLIMLFSSMMGQLDETGAYRQ